MPSLFFCCKKDLVLGLSLGIYNQFRMEIFTAIR